MPSNAQTRTKTTRKDTKTAITKTTEVVTPNRQLTRTPPPIAGTPINSPPQPQATPPPQTATPSPQTATPSPQTAMQKSPIEIAQEALEIALVHLNDSYQRALKQDEDPSKAIVETPIRTFEEIGSKVTEALHHLSQHVTQTENIEEHFSRLERSLKETIASTARRTYAQATATPEPNRIREIQQRNLERKVQQRHKQNKLDVILTMKGMDSDVKEKLDTTPPHGNYD